MAQKKFKSDTVKTAGNILAGRLTMPLPSTLKETNKELHDLGVMLHRNADLLVSLLNKYRGLLN